MGWRGGIEGSLHGVDRVIGGVGQTLTAILRVVESPLGLVTAIMLAVIGAFLWAFHDVIALLPSGLAFASFLVFLVVLVSLVVWTIKQVLTFAKENPRTLVYRRQEWVNVPYGTREGALRGTEDLMNLPAATQVLPAPELSDERPDA